MVDKGGNKQNGVGEKKENDDQDVQPEIQVNARLRDLYATFLRSVSKS